MWLHIKPLLLISTQRVASIASRKRISTTVPRNSNLDGHFVTFRERKERERERGDRARRRELKDDDLGTKRPDVFTSGWILGDKLAVRGQEGDKGPAVESR